MKQFDQFSFRCESQHQDKRKPTTQVTLAGIERELLLISKDIQSKFNLNQHLKSYLSKFQQQQPKPAPPPATTTRKYEQPPKYEQPAKQQLGFAQTARSIGYQLKNVWQNISQIHPDSPSQTPKQITSRQETCTVKELAYVESMKTAFKEGKMGAVARMSHGRAIGHSDFHYMRGQALRKMGEHQKAQAHLMKALTYQRFNCLCFQALAQNSMALREYVKAAQFYSKHLQRYDNVATRKGLALALFQSRDYLDCIMHAKEGLRQSSNDGDLLLVRALSYQQLGYKSYAQQDILAFWKVQPGYEQSQMKQFIRLQSSGQSPQAAKVLERLEGFKTIWSRIRLTNDQFK